MPVLDETRAMAGRADGTFGVVDTVVLLVALALTLLVGAVASRAAARSRLRAPGVPQAGFTLTKGAGWLQTGAIVCAALATVIVLWTVVLRVVELG